MRSRIVRSEFWTSEDTADLSHTQRLLFIGLWCMADREGMLLYKPRKISAGLFPYDSISKKIMEKHLDALKSLGLIEFGVDSKNVITCIYIPKFNEHQKIHPHEAASKLKCNYMSLDVTQCSSTSTSTSTSTSVKERLSPADEKKKNTQAQADEVLAYLNKVTGRKLGLTQNIIDCIKREKCSVEDCKLVIDSKWSEWAGTDFQIRVDHVTPWRKSNFSTYLDAAKETGRADPGKAEKIKKMEDVARRQGVLNVERD